MNAKKEFLEVISNGAFWPICADITCGKVRAILPLGYTTTELDSFLQEIDFEYDNRYGCQELFGTIWTDGGGRLERYEFDGSECRDYKEVPVIPIEVSRNNI